MQSLLRHEMFNQTLFACCLEIVIYSYNSQRTFPWVLDALNIAPYHFYKVIEVTVRAEDQLSRDMVKHLNLVSITGYSVFLRITQNMLSFPQTRSFADTEEAYQIA